MPASPEHPPAVLAIVRYGRALLYSALGLLAVGGATVQIFFPHRIGAGIDGWVLLVLVPIWTLGIVGILLLLVGWLRYPTLESRLDIDIPRGASGRMLSPFTVRLANVVVFLFWPASLLLWTEHEDVLPIWKKIVISYAITVYCGMIVYLLNLYSERKNPVTTTYLNLFTPLIGFLLAPLTWPGLVLLRGPRS